jgi:PHP family Zn ribbon phosphoesterase
MSPKEAISHNNICPVCKSTLTIGVLHRVEELADRDEGFKPKGALPFRNLIPLSELIAGALNSGVTTQKVWAEYNKLIKAFGNELKVMLDVEYEVLLKVCSEKIASLILKNRNQQIKVEPGYDGVYGKPIFENTKKGIENKKHSQVNLRRFM